LVAAAIVARPVAREWSDLFITAETPDSPGASPSSEPEDVADPADGDASPQAESEPDPGDRAAGRAARGGLIRRLRESLAKTRQALGSEIQETLFGPLDEQTWERLEEALIKADVGVSTTASVVGTLESEAGAGRLEGGEALSERLIGLLAQTATVGDGRIDVHRSPSVILVVGVNGTGKTTTIGKLAWQLQSQLGRSVLVAAADTYRAAAGEQLEGWAQRAECEIVTGPEGSDPGAVAFEAIAEARNRAVDVVIVDTAGRLHTQDELMRELGKVRRVIARQLEGAPQETLLTLDATTGQNGVRQARLFAESAPLTGIVLTKLDGSARGGIALAIADELRLPVKLIGIGESVEDLRPFDAADFARALISPG
jgi:fused signal recognition particle receptor